MACCPKDIDAVLSGACPIIGSFGAKDSQLKGAALRLEAGLTERGIAHDVKEYPNSGHAFMNPRQAGGPFFGTLLRISGAKTESG
jgi:carboxymethylenebutenolidase